MPAVRRNMERMAWGVAERGSALRPHVKAHKSPDLAGLQVDAGAAGLSVATVWEALVMAAAGYDDLFVVNTVAGADKLRVLARAGARAASPRRGGRGGERGHGRQRLLARPAARSASSSSSTRAWIAPGWTSRARPLRWPWSSPDLPGLRLEGVTGYEGHCSMEDDVVRTDGAPGRGDGARSSGPGTRSSASGPACPIVSAGGTRTWWLTAATPAITEIQAGTYVVMDAFH